MSAGSRINRRFVPDVECLEDRTVPAGNVVAYVNNGVLIVAGDNAANQFWIAGTGPTSVVIRPLDSTTTLNGQSGPLAIHGIHHGYNITTGDGNDVVIITGTRAAGTLSVQMGNGDDTLMMSGLGHTLQTYLTMGNGEDTLSINDSGFRRAVYINVGSGNDQVNLTGVNALALGMTSASGTGFFNKSNSILLASAFNGFTQGNAPPRSPTTPSVGPTATLSTTASDPTNTSPIPFTATFSAPVTGFSATGLQITNGTVSSFTPLSATTYTFQVTPTNQGLVTATVLSGAATDSSNNPNVASSTISVTFDTVAPTITVNSLTTNNPTPGITGTVDDPTATVVVVVNGQTLPATVTGNTWSTTVTSPLPDGSYSVTATATDKAGNSNSTTNASGLIVDTTAPTVAIDATPTTSGAVTGTSSDATSGVKKVQASVFNPTTSKFLSSDGTFDSSTEVFLNATSTSGTNFATWSLAVTTPGTYNINAKATDAAGNVGTSSRTGVTVT